MKLFEWQIIKLSESDQVNKQPNCCSRYISSIPAKHIRVSINQLKWCEQYHLSVTFNSRLVFEASYDFEGRRIARLNIVGLFFWEPGDLEELAPVLNFFFNADDTTIVQYVEAVATYKKECGYYSTEREDAAALLKTSWKNLYES